MTGPATDARLPVADRATVRRDIARLLRQDWRAVAGATALTCLAAVAGLSGPWLLGRIIDRVEAGDATSGIVNLLAMAVGACALAQLVLTRFARYAAHRFGERTLDRLRVEVIEQALALPVRVVERAGTGELLTRSSADVSTVGTTLRDAVPDVFVSGMQVLFLFVAVFVLHPLLGVCALVGLPVVWWVTRWYLARARDAYLAAGQAVADVSESMSATATGARTVEAFDMGGERVDHADAAIDHSYRTARRTLYLRSVLFPVTDFTHLLPVAMILLVGGLAYVDDVVSLGAVVSASLYMWQLVDPLDRVLARVEQLQSGAASFARIKGVGLVPTASAGGGLVPADDRIEASGVRYSYVDGQDVLHGVDLVVRPGERLAVVGPSGAGKSTLGRLLAGVEPPRVGHVTVGGIAAAELAADESARHVVLVTQEHHVFIGTLRENLAMAAPSASDEEMWIVLATVEADWAAELPDGLDTALGAGGRQLDPASTQQLALARVMLADPHTLVLDEATSMLDPRTARQAERSIAAVLDGRTVIAIAHRLHTAEDADRVAVMEAGRITELGTHEELVAANGSYAALWRSWHGAESLA